MAKDGRYGKKSGYPYYFKYGKNLSMESGTFKTKKSAKEAAEKFTKGTSYKYRVLKR